MNVKLLITLSIAVIVGAWLACKVWPKYCPMIWAAVILSPIPPIP